MLGISAKNLMAGIAWALVAASVAGSEIVRPDDAPKPLTPEQSAAAVTLPPGYRLELVAAEPLVVQPSGVCWDAQGQLFVSELHGYNLEGQYDVEELNKTGKLDREVRRIPAPAEAIERAERDQFGVIKLLHDDDGDGRMDRAGIWAEGLPPCIGICPSRGGIIAACAPDIIYLADRDGDGKAETREVLFTGFALGPLERRINYPRLGPDNWIYFGRGKSCRVTGPGLAGPVDLPSTDFRIKADGSAIEPVTGGTHSVGFTFTGGGQRFVATTGSPGHFVTPLSWRYLARNPHMDAGSLQGQASDYRNCFPTSKPHPWRARRASDPGFSKFYRDRYGAAESEASGWFTSGCSPLVYQDSALPDLQGDYLVCEPAGNLVHRAEIVRDGDGLKLVRKKHERESEFLASEDIWFHPIYLSHAPDGSLMVVDFYREIIEDYSAIPRYLQQLYELDHGKDRGRLWRVVSDRMPNAPSSDMARLDGNALVDELGSEYYWRRQTARRLLTEAAAGASPESVAKLHRTVQERGAKPMHVMNGLHVLEGLGQLSVASVLAGLDHPDPLVRIQALRLSEILGPGGNAKVVADKLAAMVGDTDPNVRLQLALTLGEDPSDRIIPSLVALSAGDSPHLRTAIQSSLSGRELVFLQALARSGSQMVDVACGWVAATGRGRDIGAAIVMVKELADPSVQRSCLGSIGSAVRDERAVKLPESAIAVLEEMGEAADPELKRAANTLYSNLRPETEEERHSRIEGAMRSLLDVSLAPADRAAAARELLAENEADAVAAVIRSLRGASPSLRVSLIEALFSRHANLPVIMKAIDDGELSVSAIPPTQRQVMLTHPDKSISQRSEKLFQDRSGKRDIDFTPFLKALEGERHTARGAELFKTHCATCHRYRGAGNAIGPDLTGETDRADLTFLQDILAPSAEISPGYSTYSIELKDGSAYVGLITDEAPAYLVLADISGARHRLQREKISSVLALDASLMPETLSETLTPTDVGDILAWLKSGGGKP